MRRYLLIEDGTPEGIKMCIYAKGHGQDLYAHQLADELGLGLISIEDIANICKSSESLSCINCRYKYECELIRAQFRKIPSDLIR